MFGTEAVAQSSYADHSRLASGSWYKIPVATSGVYIINTADVAELYGTSCNQIALFGAPGGMLAVSNKAAHPDDMVAAAIEVVDMNGNGTFEMDDYILFYGEGPSVWRYMNSDQLFEYSSHAYANYNYYYLTTTYTQIDSSLRLQHPTFTPNSSNSISTYTAVALLHEDKINPVEGGELWMADKFTSSFSSRSYTLLLPSAPSAGTIEARYGLAHLSDYSGQFGFQSGGETWTNNFDANTTYSIFKRNLSSTNSNEVSLNIAYTPRENSATGYLDFIELNAIVPLSYLSGQQFIRNKQQIQEGSVSQFVGTGHTSGMRLWDVTDPSQPCEIAIQTSGNNGFSFAAPTDAPKTFMV
ncbi:MAG: hypothetical protein II555_05310 [Bacteroidales bacterium]|nr:hypothetical protein [Bacteroidales bacterium]